MSYSVSDPVLSDQSYIDISLIKQWFYCPRYVYFRYVLGMSEPPFEYVIEGRDLHNSLINYEEFRKTLFYRRFKYDRKVSKVFVYCEKFRIKGILDMLIFRNGIPIPIEIKLSMLGSRDIPIHHKAQLTAYALCLEEMFRRAVCEGYLYYVKSDKLVRVDITEDLKKLVIDEIEKLRKCLIYGDIPRRAASTWKCANCWFRKYCVKMSF